MAYQLLSYPIKNLVYEKSTRKTNDKNTFMTKEIYR